MKVVSGLARVVIVWLFLALPSMAQDYFLHPRGEDFQYNPSPEDWRDINMYQVFTDRFFDGDPGNNNVRGWHTTDGYRHYAMGGDWQGVKQKLPYLQGMGVNAIWISGVQMNEQGVDTRYAPYHAYHPTDYYRAEPQFGTFDDLKDLIDTAHSMDIYVIVDVVINHMADRAGLGGSLDDYYHPWGGGDLFWWDNNVRHAWPFDGLHYFHNNGKITDWNDGGQLINGAFVGTDDLRTSDEYVQGHLIDIFKNLIDATDCDGFRVDAIKHVEEPFMMHWANEMRNHAAYRGKDNFILFGENFNYNDWDVAHHTKDYGFAFNSALYFPMQLTMKNVFAYEQGTRQITDRRNNLHLYGEGQNNLVTFMDNHDVDRIALEAGDSWEAKLRPALTFLYTGTPVPCLFYGTEHGFNQGYQRNQGLEDGDYQREVMWDYGYQPGNAWGDKFHESPLYNYIGQLNDLRSQYRSLTRGDFTTRWEENSSGIYAYTRVYEEEEALVIFNTDWGTRSATPAVGKPDGTEFVNMLNPSETLTVQGGQLDVSVEGKESKIFIAAAAARVTTDCLPDALTITYDPEGGPLADAGTVYIGIGHDGFQNHDSFEMAWDGEVYSYTYSTTNADAEINFYFRDNEEPPTYDNRDGANWSVDVLACRANGEQITWAGGTHHWPDNDALTSADDLWINIFSEPVGAAGGARVVYSSDGGETWALAHMNHAGTTENDHDWWHVNLGSYAEGTTIQYAIEVVGARNAVWDNNSNANYLAQVGEGGAGIQWVGNTRHWPLTGSIKPSDDLWIDVDSRPAGVALGGDVIYSVDSGSNWTVVALAHNGVQDGGDNPDADAWHANLGSFPGQTLVRYAVVLRDAADVEMWDNNQGADYIAEVNQHNQAVTWFGNAGAAGAMPVGATLRGSEAGGLALSAPSSAAGTVFRVMRSPDLLEWFFDRYVISSGDASDLEIDLQNDDDVQFYRIELASAPSSDVITTEQGVLIRVEVEPPGSTRAVNLVYSIDGADWEVKPMSSVGLVSEERMVYSVLLGHYPSGTTIQYAIEIVDFFEESLWDNNDGDDYLIEIE